MICLRTLRTIFLISYSGVSNCLTNVGIIVLVYCDACRGYINGIINPTALRKAPKDRSLNSVILSYNGIRTQSKASIPYG